ncbi:type IV pilin protein [Legionella maioricensis]|uniref:Prepilin-type N-terminal cleavage/methylation domain-containing protein n=1 Tax=Legionella maioricensis TaxID=2896528 RepID=A0A9X2D2L4_9GAMM|nr:type IV pilin protein [Legionella maioricensis]MCL9685318.1 prepilin-type N-terminal cleavage/methylation domain-containing protein [Legionella maioricensis]MCL9688573.1 prepilin-type N-terminal cleavage/methylation domain-containing protein [Legionella maioricensis]
MNTEQHIKRNNPGMQGFTLIELLIALLVFAILIGIAYPSYKTYVLRSHRVDALQTLAQDQLILERCYSQNFSYNGACGALPAFPQVSTQGFYRIAISNTGATTYTLTATPLGTQVEDTTCASISVNQANVRTATDSSGTAQSKCWDLR